MNRLKAGSAGRVHRSAVSDASWQEWISEAAVSRAVPQAAPAAAPIAAPISGAHRTDVDRQSLHEAIARLAYANWEARGRPHGSADEDWLLAERQLLHRTTGS